jgi:hypothetical protein
MRNNCIGLPFSSVIEFVCCSGLLTLDSAFLEHLFLRLDEKQVVGSRLLQYVLFVLLFSLGANKCSSIRSIFYFFLSSAILRWRHSLWSHGSTCRWPTQLELKSVRPTHRLKCCQCYLEEKHDVESNVWCHRRVRITSSSQQPRYSANYTTSSPWTSSLLITALGSDLLLVSP